MSLAAGSPSSRCALLAFWLVARHPGVGPKTLRGCFLGCLVSLAFLTALVPALDAAIAVSGRAVADPILLLSFWTGALLIRAFLSGASAQA